MKLLKISYYFLLIYDFLVWNHSEHLILAFLDEASASFSIDNSKKLPSVFDVKVIVNV